MPVSAQKTRTPILINIHCTIVQLQVHALLRGDQDVVSGEVAIHTMSMPNWDMPSSDDDAVSAEFMHLMDGLHLVQRDRLVPRSRGPEELDRGRRRHPSRPGADAARAATPSLGEREGGEGHIAAVLVVLVRWATVGQVPRGKLDAMAQHVCRAPVDPRPPHNELTTISSTC
jgi:hypothetical protein